MKVIGRNSRLIGVRRKLGWRDRDLRELLNDAKESTCTGFGGKPSGWRCQSTNVLGAYRPAPPPIDLRG